MTSCWGSSVPRSAWNVLERVCSCSSWSCLRVEFRQAKSSVSYAVHAQLQEKRQKRSEDPLILQFDEEVSDLPKGSPRSEIQCESISTDVAGTARTQDGTNLAALPECLGRLHRALGKRPHRPNRRGRYSRTRKVASPVHAG